MPSATPLPPKKAGTGKGPPEGSSEVQDPQHVNQPSIGVNNGVAIGRDNNGTTIVFGNVPRTVTPEQDKALSVLGPPPPGFDGIACIMGDSESCAYATQIMNAINRSGWNIKGLDLILTEPVLGVFITVPPDEALTPPDGTIATFNALSQAGLPVKVLRVSSQKRGTFRILIAGHPNR